MPMKLFIQVPCLNEANTLSVTIGELPRSVPGFDSVEWLIVDDGSTDDTSEVARTLGVDHVVRHPVKRGLAKAFMTGLEACLSLGADVIVNIDADNQYRAADIPLLTSPIIEGRADLVVGARPIEGITHFSRLKKRLQRLGSWAVRVASSTDVEDAASGFRALSRETALHLNVFSAYTYTLETIIQAGQSNLRVLSVPIRTNSDLRPSRLVKSVASYVHRSIWTILRVFVIYRPLATFLCLGVIVGSVGAAATLRFLYYWLTGNGAGHVQSVVLGAMLLVLAALCFMMGLVGELISANRKILEQIRVSQRRKELRARIAPSRRTEPTDCAGS